MFAITSQFIKGMIIEWPHSIASIPSGWVLCDGNNGTPDLRDSFIVGAKQDDGGVAKSNIEGSLKQTGGATNHLHTILISGAGDLLPGTDVAAGGDHSKSTYISLAGAAASAVHVPTYHALVFIMRVV